jgi:hypothetical protein
LLIAILVNGICIMGFFGIVKREQYFAGEGIVLPAFDRNKRILGMGIFAAICIAVAILVSSDIAILPFSLIAGFFGRLSALFRRPVPALSETPPLPTMTPMDFGQPFQDIGTEVQGPSLFWEWMKYVLIALAAAGFIVFMISPLLNRGSSKGKLTFRRRLYRIIAEWLKGILSALKSFFVFIGHSMAAGKTGRGLLKPGRAEIKRMAETVLGAYTQAKNREMRQSITLFARLIIWGGEARNVEWKPSLAPGEYCTLLAAAAPSATAPPSAADKSALKRQNSGIIRCGELFEKALYSAEVLSEAERNEFKEQVELVVRTT